MKNIKDWCISRQLWWGHRIPAWYCKDCKKVTVARKDPTQCKSCKSSHIEQDPDVLDTWFSAGLWPFATLGWPKKTPDLAKFYPNTVMETGHDILFFWVVRMIMMSLKFMKKIPFRYVYLHPLILDKDGNKKMSKSSGNAIDPLDVSEKYGADALRYTLLVLSAHSRAIRLDIEEVGGYRNFMNKIWNASRFALNFLDHTPKSVKANFSFIDQWILTRMQEVIESVTEDLECFKLGEGAQTLYQFVWHEFCDWYIELIKPVLYGEEKGEKEKTLFVLHHTLENILKLLHPFSPHISEEIWHHLPGKKEALIISEYPKPNKKFLFKNSKKYMHYFMELINTVRNIRGENNIAPSKKTAIHCLCKNKDVEKLLTSSKQAFLNLTKGSDLIFEKDKKFTEKGLFGHGNFQGTEVFVSLSEAVNVEEEVKRLQKEMAKTESDLREVRNRLSNEGFVSRAPKNVVEEHRERARDLESKQSKMKEALQKLQGLQ